MIDFSLTQHTWCVSAEGEVCAHVCVCVCVGGDIPSILVLPEERGKASHAHTHTTADGRRRERCTYTPLRLFTHPPSFFKLSTHQVPNTLNHPSQRSFYFFEVPGAIRLQHRTLVVGLNIRDFKLRP